MPHRDSQTREEQQIKAYEQDPGTEEADLGVIPFKLSIEVEGKNPLQISVEKQV